MNLARNLSARDAAVAAGVGLGSALLMAWLLVSVAGSGELGRRLERLSSQADVAESALRTARRDGGFPIDAICTEPPDRQAVALDTALRAEAGRLRLDLRGLEISPLADPTFGLKPIRIRFQASGSYEDALQVLGVLSGRRPQVFADVVDLTSKASSVTLVFSGRVFCSDHS